MDDSIKAPDALLTEADKEIVERLVHKQPAKANRETRRRAAKLGVPVEALTIAKKYVHPQARRIDQEKREGIIRLHEKAKAARAAKEAKRNESATESSSIEPQQPANANG